MSPLNFDLLPLVCEYVHDLRALYRISQVDRNCGRYLLSACAGRHWARAAKLLCGDEFWDDASFRFDGRMPPERYKAMLHVCPWRSAPMRLRNHGIHALELLGSEWQMHRMVLVDNELRFGVTVEADDNVKGGERIVSMPARCDRADHYGSHVRRPGRALPPEASDPVEEELFARLNGNGTFLARAEDRHLGRLVLVRIVHRGTFMALFDSMWMLFFTRDGLRFLGGCECLAGYHLRALRVLVRPAALWVAHDAEVTYFGPRDGMLLDARSAIKMTLLRRSL